ncbi:MAG TPA: TetR/AcrR family transcriptional regulator [Sphaerochaeta sp.]|nr:TetR/AcrR family transcriptional regulator [Sphaerochaeta sp.]
MAKKLINGKTKAEQTKQRIFESALALFTKKGFENVSVEQITKNAGTSKGNFYTYFSTKSDIIVQQFLTIDAYYRSTEKIVLEEETCSQMLLKFTELQLTYVRDVIGCATLKILYANQVLQEGSDKVITDRNRFWHSFICTIIESGQRKGEFIQTVDSKFLAISFNRAIRGLFLDWNISSASFDLVEEGLLYCRDFLLCNMIENNK